MPPRHHVALDSWRGIAALMVALYHFQTTSVVFQSALFRNAWLFVDFFFVLSGFVIAANYRDRLAEGFGAVKFLLLRLGRLYPLHVVMLFGFVATELALYLAASGMKLGSGREYFTGQTAPIGILTNLLLIQGLGIHNGLTWNGVAWSISTEMWAYVVFAVLATRFAKSLDSAMWLIIAVMFVYCLIEKLLPPGSGRFMEFARCLYGFCVGVLLHKAFLAVDRAGTVDRMSIGRITAIEAVALVLAVVFVIVARELPTHALAPMAFAPAVLVYAFDRGRISRLLQARSLVFMGTLSYSIYLIHPFVQTRILLPIGLAVQKVTGLPLLSVDQRPGGTFIWGASELQSLILTGMMAAVVIACAWMTYRLIEAPGRDMMRRAVSRPAQTGWRALA